FGAEEPPTRSVAVVAEIDSAGAPEEAAAGIVSTIRQAIFEEHEVACSAILLVKPQTLPRTTSGKLQRIACWNLFVNQQLQERCIYRSDSHTRELQIGGSDNPLIWQLREEAAAILGLDTPEAVDPSLPLVDFGLDSLRLVELNAFFEEKYGVGLPLVAPHLLSVAQLAQHLEETLRLKQATPPKLGRFETDDAEPSDRILHPQSAQQLLNLSSDDVVPNSMILVMGFPEKITAGVFLRALQGGLDAFPHLAGRVCGDFFSPDFRIEPDSDGIRVEFRTIKGRPSFAELELTGDNELRQQFAPTAVNSSSEERQPLFAARLTDFEDESGTVLAFFVSHIALDGVGAAHLFYEMMASIHNIPHRELDHHRQHLQQASSAAKLPAALPHWYLSKNRPDGADHEWNLAQNYGADVYRISDRQLGDGSSDWLQLIEHLWSLLNEKCGADYRELAFWCDVRGSLGISDNYTGNVGCYWHCKTADQLAFPGTPEGRARIAGIYQGLKYAEKNRRPVSWIGVEGHVLPVNLVPFSHTSLNFGGGRLQFARMLTRNVHGLRVSRSVSGDAFLVEACLPPSIRQALATELKGNELK
ncbi:MAG: phosphopantetheine-binding protein, partial [Planctomycetota bacterium]